MAYGNFKDLPGRTTSDEILRDKAFNIAKNLKFDDYQIRLASMMYIFLIKRLQAPLKNSTYRKWNYGKPRISSRTTQTNCFKFGKRSVYSYFKDNILGADLVDIWLISKYDKGIKLILRIVHMHGLFL